MDAPAQATETQWKEVFQKFNELVANRGLKTEKQDLLQPIAGGITKNKANKKGKGTAKNVLPLIDLSTMNVEGQQFANEKPSYSGISDPEFVAALQTLAQRYGTAKPTPPPQVINMTPVQENEFAVPQVKRRKTEFTNDALLGKLVNTYAARHVARPSQKAEYMKRQGKALQVAPSVVVYDIPKATGSKEQKKQISLDNNLVKNKIGPMRYDGFLFWESHRHSKKENKLAKEQQGLNFRFKDQWTRMFGTRYSNHLPENPLALQYLHQQNIRTDSEKEFIRDLLERDESYRRVLVALSQKQTEENRKKLLEWKKKLKKKIIEDNLGVYWIKDENGKTVRNPKADRPPHYWSKDILKKIVNEETGRKREDIRISPKLTSLIKYYGPASLDYFREFLRAFAPNQKRITPSFVEAFHGWLALRVEGKMKSLHKVAFSKKHGIHKNKATGRTSVGQPKEPKGRPLNLTDEKLNKNRAAAVAARQKYFTQRMAYF